MNIKIDKIHHERLQENCIHQIVMGSQLYGTNTKDSDKDVLCIYKPLEHWNLLEELPNFHQFQYTEEGVDYIYCTEGQFWKNQRSGDSTINSDIIMFSDVIVGNKHSKLLYCRTQKVVKAYIGFANRDIKQYGKINSDKKYFHILRGLYTASCLLDGKLPDKEEIKRQRTDKYLSIKELQDCQNELRNQCNTLYEKKVIENYYIEQTSDELFNLLLNSNNTREFRYE